MLVCFHMKTDWEIYARKKCCKNTLFYIMAAKKYLLTNKYNAVGCGKKCRMQKTLAPKKKLSD